MVHAADARQRLSGRYVTQSAATSDPNPYRYDNGDPVNDGYSYGFNRVVGNADRWAVGDDRLARASDTQLFLATAAASTGLAVGGWAAYAGAAGATTLGGATWAGATSFTT